ncbi:MAG: DUF1501 domain-containing protein [Pirellulales bacterium]|nr:DUF1501 domain-containing protein [Pirellulales bacterium]
MLDFYLGRDKRSFCSGTTRRDFMRVGGLGMLGLGLADILKLEACAQEAHIQGTPSAPRAKSVILVFLGGGLSHHDTFDMKPGAPAEIRGKYGSIPTKIPGLSICELLPKMADVMDRLTLVRSGAHHNDHHETATNWVLSGRFGSPFGDFPAIGAVVSQQLGFRGVLPPYMAIPKNPSFTWELGKSAFLGGRYESFATGDPNNQNFQVRDLSPAGNAAGTRLERRESLLAAVDSLQRQVEGNDQIATYDEFRRRAANMVLTPEAKKAFDIKSEDETLRDRYGRNTFGQSCLLARRLIEHNIRFATVNYGGWDHHGKIFENLDNKLPEFDRGFSALIEDLDQRGLLKDTLVVCMGEFGRTPKINKDAGRDHWGPAASLLFAGAGIARGKIIGQTDRTGSQVLEQPIAPADVAHTILTALGINPDIELTTPDGRIIPILDKGEFVRELFV